MNTTTLVTQRDVARACNLHPSTVCLALGNSSAIPLETRVRVQEAARQLGYQPNVAARNLAALRSDRRSTSMPMAWLNQEAAKDFWHTDPVGQIHFKAAAQRAAEMGYYLDEFWTQEKGMSASRLAQIIQARGIEGVVFPVAGMMDRALLQPVWGEFAAVASNDHRMDEWVDVVCPDYYHNTDMALTHLRSLGTGRIGLVLTASFDAATHGSVASRFLRDQSAQPAARRVPICMLDGDVKTHESRYKEWLRKHQPEVVICRDHALETLFTGESVPDSFLQLSTAGNAHARGVDERTAEIAAMTIDCLVSKVRRFQKGLRGQTCRHLIKGSLHTGLIEERIAAVA